MSTPPNPPDVTLPVQKLAREAARHIRFGRPRSQPVCVDGDASRYFLGHGSTGRRIEIQEISIFKVAEGRIVEQWRMFDELARLQQLGVGVDHLRRALRLQVQ